MAWYWLVPVLSSIVYLLSMIAVNANRTGDVPRAAPWLRYYALIEVCTVPMFLLGWDWGRWLVSSNISFAFLWLAVDDRLLPQLVPWHVWYTRLQGATALQLAPRRIDRLERAVALSRAQVAQIEALVEQLVYFIRKQRWFAIAAMTIFALTFRIPESGIVTLGGGWIVPVVKMALHWRSAR
jgi:hypothetical protein